MGPVLGAPQARALLELPSVRGEGTRVAHFL